jgi:hypothetical protein
MTKFYQWILRNNQQTCYPNFTITEEYYPTEELVRAYCCVENLYSPICKVEESEIDLSEAPYLKDITVSSLPDDDDDYETYVELKAHAEDW